MNVEHNCGFTISSRQSISALFLSKNSVPNQSKWVFVLIYSVRKLNLCESVQEFLFSIYELAGTIVTFAKVIYIYILCKPIRVILGS
jgi:hypothetical protein